MAPGTVFTEFYVDHKEPLEVLDKFRVKGKWCLGDLLVVSFPSVYGAQCENELGIF
jgi:hypothetical protein